MEACKYGGHQRLLRRLDGMVNAAGLTDGVHLDGFCCGKSGVWRGVGVRARSLGRVQSAVGLDSSTSWPTVMATGCVGRSRPA